MINNALQRCRATCAMLSRRSAWRERLSRSVECGLRGGSTKNAKMALSGLGALSGRGFDPCPPVAVPVAVARHSLTLKIAYMLNNNIPPPQDSKIQKQGIDDSTSRYVVAGRTHTLRKFKGGPGRGGDQGAAPGRDVVSAQAEGGEGGRARP